MIATNSLNLNFLNNNNKILKFDGAGIKTNI